MRKAKSFGKKEDDLSSKPKTSRRPREGDAEQTGQPWMNDSTVKEEKLALRMVYNSRPNGRTRKRSKFLPMLCCLCGWLCVWRQHAAFEHKATPH